MKPTSTYLSAKILRRPNSNRRGVAFRKRRASMWFPRVRARGRQRDWAPCIASATLKPMRTLPKLPVGRPPTRFFAQLDNYTGRPEGTFANQLKPLQRLTFRCQSGRGISRAQREILAWLYLLDECGEATQNGVRWRPRQDAFIWFVPHFSASQSRSLARLEARALVTRYNPSGRTTHVQLTATGRDVGAACLPQFRDSFQHRINRLSGKSLS